MELGCDAEHCWSQVRAVAFDRGRAWTWSAAATLDLPNPTRMVKLRTKLIVLIILLMKCIISNWICWLRICCSDFLGKLQTRIEREPLPLTCKPYQPYIALIVLCEEKHEPRGILCPRFISAINVLSHGKLFYQLHFKLRFPKRTRNALLSSGSNGPSSRSISVSQRP